MFKTRVVSQNEVTEKWYLIDASGQRIGRVATIAAELLLGKRDVLNRAYLTPKTKVVITNVGKLDITEKKRQFKTYTAYSGYPGGLRTDTLEEKMSAKPTNAVELAIRRMLPKTKRGKAIFSTNLRVYAGSDHPHTAQTLEKVELNKIKI